MKKKKKKKRRNKQEKTVLGIVNFMGGVGVERGAGERK